MFAFLDSRRFSTLAGQGTDGFFMVRHERNPSLSNANRWTKFKLTLQFGYIKANGVPIDGLYSRRYS